MLESFWDDFGAISGSFFLGFFIWGTKLGSSGEPGSACGEPPPPSYTIRFSIKYVRTPKASLVGEQSRVKNKAGPQDTPTCGGTVADMGPSLLSFGLDTGMRGHRPEKRKIPINPVCEII